MWLIFQKSDGKVIGASADSAVDLGKEQALREAASGLADAGAIEDYDAVQVTDRSRMSSLHEALRQGELVVRTTRSGELEIKEERPDVFVLRVTTDATEFHPVDNVPLIPGDGESFLTIQIQKINDEGKPFERKKDNDELWLRTDHGTLRDEKGKDIRSLKLSSGKAAFRLHSEPARRLASVRIFNGDQNVYDTVVRVEFT